MMSHKEEFRESGNLVIWVRVMLGLQVALAIAFIIVSGMDAQMIKELSSGLSTPEQLLADINASDERKAVLGDISIFLFIVSGIVILGWIHRISYNARQLGAVDMKYTPGWSVGYYFIPILMLWRPYQVMAEVWKASTKPSDWSGVKVSPIVDGWWALWIISHFLNWFASKTLKVANDLGTYSVANKVFGLSCIFDLALAVVFFVLVNAIHEMQQKHFISNKQQDLQAA